MKWMSVIWTIWVLSIRSVIGKLEVDRKLTEYRKESYMGSTFFWDIATRHLMNCA